MKQFTDEQIDSNETDAIKGAASNGDDLPETSDPPELRQAKDLARRYRLPFVNLLPQDGESPIDYGLLSEVPVDLMVRNQFVPLKRENGKLHIAMADPTDLGVGAAAEFPRALLNGDALDEVVDAAGVVGAARGKSETTDKEDALDGDEIRRIGANLS